MTELQRIQAIPWVDGRVPASLPDPWTEALRTPNGKAHFRPAQIAALNALNDAVKSGTTRGVVGDIGLGHGKTLLTLVANKVIRAKRPLLLIRPAMREQLQADVHFWQEHFDLDVPKIVTYSELSSANGKGILDSYRPDFIICDEAQALRHPTAARTKRFLRYVYENQNTRLFLLSATLTSKSLNDWAHLIWLGLREYCPIPDDIELLNYLACVADPDGEPDGKARVFAREYIQAVGGTLPLGGIFGIDEREPLRKALAHRLRYCPGYVSTEDVSCNAELVWSPLLPTPSQELKTAMQKLITKWELPAEDGCATENGEPVSDAARAASAARCLSNGFYYKWVWPNGQIDHEWLAARAMLAKEIRNELQYGVTRQDTPATLLTYAAKHPERMPKRFRDAQAAWAAVAERPAPTTTAVWVDSQVIPQMLEVAKSRVREGFRVIVWYRSRAIGEFLTCQDIPVYGAGDDIGQARAPLIAASIDAHGTGKNLQAYNWNIVLEPPKNGATWDQLIGRTHRAGQTAAVIGFEIAQHSRAFQACLYGPEGAFELSKYIQQTQGQPQRLMAIRKVANASEYAKTLTER